MLDKELHALIRLLEDPDPEVHALLVENLHERGAAVIDQLEQFRKTTQDQQIRQLLTPLMHDLHYQNISEQLKQWAESGGKDILPGAYWLARYHYNDLSINDLNAPIELLREDLLRCFVREVSPLQQIRLVNHVFYNLHHFVHTSTYNFEPQNVYINQVLHTHKGSDIGLGVAYLALTQSVGLPVYGIALPKNLILCYCSPQAKWPYQSRDVLFYINPYNRGMVLSLRGLDYFIYRLGINNKSKFYQPVSNIKVIQRLIISLTQTYQHLAYPDKVKEMQQLAQMIVNHDPQI